MIHGTIDLERIQAALRTGWPNAVLIDAPQPITGGEWASLYRLHLSGLPEGVPDDLVLRVAPQADMAAKEQAVQEAAADAGVPTPRIRLAGPAGGPLDDAWSVMDVAPGAPLLADLDATRALTHLPGILRRLPSQLADTMAAIHRVETRPVIDRVRSAAPTVALTLDELWPHLAAGARDVGRPDLARAVDHLADTRPDATDAVLCHGSTRQPTSRAWTGTPPSTPSASSPSRPVGPAPATPGPGTIRDTSWPREPLGRWPASPALTSGTYRSVRSRFPRISGEDVASGAPPIVFGTTSRRPGRPQEE